ncbi:MAG: MBL fold metallo-hydrolase [Anaerolineae bacterium]|jgi:competence protein ComEC
MASLDIYLLNVGQADTSIIKTPAGNIIIVDAVRPKKVRALLNTLRPDGQIAHLIVTHPHNDHYSAVPSLLKNFEVQRVTLAPFWHEPGSPGYHDIINEIIRLGTPIQFLSGYQRTYPDGGRYPNYEGRPELEMLGPSNSALEALWESGVLNPNHLSIITRLTYGEFRMVFAADAQMENWHYYDQEGMLENQIDVLRAAHHGSRNGSQWERLERLAPKLVVVSSDLGGRHHLPDLVGSAVFFEYGRVTERAVALTHHTGTIKIQIEDPSKHTRRVVSFGEKPNEDVPPGPEIELSETNWQDLVEHRMHGPAH